MKPLHVVQWSTGGCGAIAVRILAERKNLELVGVWVHDDAKAGRDVGVIVGTEPLGIDATNDSDALLALAPDCISYTASGESRPAECIADFTRFLERGIDVVTTSVPGLLHPAGFDADAVAAVEDAGKRNGTYRLLVDGDPSFQCSRWAATRTPTITACSRQRCGS